MIKSALFLLAALIIHDKVHAEPYLAVQQGLKCMQCHINPSGGGERTQFGEVFAQNIMPAQHVDTGQNVWTGMLNEFVGVGGNLRADAAWQHSKDQAALSQFSLEQARIYLSVSMIPDQLLFYMDEQVGPGPAINREAWAQVWLFNKRGYIKAGQMYLPFGLRLQDQDAFIGQIAGINMTTPDQGVEVGFERDAWDAKVAISNGASGGAESDNNKQFTGQVAYVKSAWRVGLGFDVNRINTGQVRGAALFTGLRTGSWVWLAEVDQVSSPAATAGTRTTQWATLLETDWQFARGHNLKLAAEWSDPDRAVSDNTRRRLSIVYEWTPIQFVQLRGGWRRLESQADVSTLQVQQAFMQLHAFF